MSPDLSNKSYVNNPLHDGKIDKHDFVEKTKKGKWRLREWALLAVLFLVIIGGVIVTGVWLSRSPAEQQLPKVIEIPSGSTLKKVAGILEQEGVVQSKQWFQLIAYAKQEQASMQAGLYRFEEELSVFDVVDKIAEGEQGDIFTRVTIPEGFTTKEVSRVIADTFDHITYDEFIEVAEEFNGFLYPETYFFNPDVTVEEIVDQMHTEFSKTLAEVAANQLRGLEEGDLREFVTMASIIEREAYGASDAYIISGILWKRIEEGIPMQVDAPFHYLLGKASSELTLSDLNIDSPYNTYKYKGLTPGPIGNPGAIALDAAFHPADSPYYFYLHDSEGNIHYGKTHNDHVNNKNKYLQN